MTPRAIHLMVPAIVRADKAKRSRNLRDLRAVLENDGKNLTKLLRRLEED